MEKKEKNPKGIKKDVKSRKGPLGPEWSPKWYKTKHLARVRNGPLRGEVSLESKLAPKRQFRSSKHDNKTCRILRTLLFSNNDFSDGLCQNDSFCCMICTGFWKRGRSKEVLEAQRKGTICSLT